MNWTALWLHLFGTTTFLGINLGFWVSLGLVVLVTAGMNVVFWAIPPKQD